MKRVVAVIVSLLLSLAAYSQTGTWSGKVNVQGTSLSVVFHLDESGCTFDSPDQGARGIPAEASLSDLGKVVIKVPSIGATYEGLWLGGRIVGSLSQSGSSFPLTLVPGEPELKRPQTPVGPFPYSCEEVSFSNGDAVLKGTLVLPEGYTRDTPAVIMVTGSGQQNRDEELMQHKPFLVIADYLARHGIATLRYDDRATGASVGGDVKNATSEDFARDAAAGLEYLRNTKAFSKVGILGHSEGGLIAFMLGGKKGRDNSVEGYPDFIGSLAGPGVKGDTLLAAQGNRILSLSGMPADMTVEKYRQQDAVQQMPWLKWFIDYDPSADIAATRCPVFALNGDRDCQVISKQNLTAIKQLLSKSTQNCIKEYPGLNHLFQHCTTGLPNEYGQIEETISPEVLQDIAAWMNSLK